MIHNKSILKFTDYLCKYTNKVFPNNFDDKYLTQPIKRIIAFNCNYKKLTYKEFYVLYDIRGTSRPYCVDYEDYDGNYIATIIADELPNLMDFVTIKTAFNKYSGRIIAIEKIYDITINTIKAIVRIDCKI